MCNGIYLLEYISSWRFKSCRMWCSLDKVDPYVLEGLFSVKWPKTEVLLLWDVLQPWLIVCYWYIGTTYWSHLPGLSSPRNCSSRWMCESGRPKDMATLLIYRRPDYFLSLIIYQIPACTSLFLNPGSYDCHSSKQAAVDTLVQSHTQWGEPQSNIKVK
jgi:hypothetical protein